LINHLVASAASRPKRAVPWRNTRLRFITAAAGAAFHKSFAVYRDHVETVAPKPGGGRMLRMSVGTSVPVGRSYAAADLEAVR